MYQSLLIIILSYLVHATSLDIYSGQSRDRIFINPAQLDYDTQEDKRAVEFGGSIALAKKTGKFLEELHKASGDFSDIAKLMEKNIGNTLSFSSEFFMPLRCREEKFDWLIALMDSTDGYFITHSGFGSKGAMESYVQRYQGFVGTLSTGHDQVNFGINLKLLQHSLTVHNYSIGEMMEMNGIWEYMDNRYTQQAHGIGVDLGTHYHFYSDVSFGLSLLNVGDTAFDELISIPSTLNITYSQLISVEDHPIYMDVVYVDFLNKDLSNPLKKNLKLDLHSSIWNDRLKLRTGMTFGSWNYGMSYCFSYVSVSLDSYSERGRNKSLPKERHYQLSLVLGW
ncbi:MAG TPA: hypothetical protein ENK86_01705 [Campylobacterales bacterium]|nr:hypothetical protein [Campylobacterales bacterium]